MRPKMAPVNVDSFERGIAVHVVALEGGVFGLLHVGFEGLAVGELYAAFLASKKLGMHF